LGLSGRCGAAWPALPEATALMGRWGGPLNSRGAGIRVQGGSWERGGEVAWALWGCAASAVPPICGLACMHASVRPGPFQLGFAHMHALTLARVLVSVCARRPGAPGTAPATATAMPTCCSPSPRVSSCGCPPSCRPHAPTCCRPCSRGTLRSARRPRSCCSTRSSRGRCVGPAAHALTLCLPCAACCACPAPRAVHGGEQELPGSARMQAWGSNHAQKPAAITPGKLRQQSRPAS